MAAHRAVLIGKPDLTTPPVPATIEAMDDTGESVRSPDQALGKVEVIEAFIERWRDTGGKERANYQLFLTELCQLLDLPGPEPAGGRVFF